MVKPGTTDDQLIQVFEGELRNILIRQFNVDPLRAKQAAPQLVRRIGKGVRQCSRSHTVPEVIREIPFMVPSEEDCRKLKEDIESIIVVRYGEIPKNRKMSFDRKIAGKVWEAIVDAVGREEQLEFERSAAGPRG